MKRFLDHSPATPLPQLKGCIATLGVFDGVHMGHQAILESTLNWARTEERPAVMITFSVHPDLVVHGRAPPLLQSLDHRLRILERFGVDAAVVLPFNAALRDCSPEDFVQQVLVTGLGIRGLVLGHDTAVGKNRAGDAARLRELGNQHGFEVHVVGEISLDGQVISSTRIREALQSGELENAAQMLGRSPSILGEVVQGDQRGRTIGFPTANLDAGSECLPAVGVYATLVLHKGKRHAGLCNVGRRPTFETVSTVTLEVHLLGFEGDLYGETLEVVFLQHLRGEKKFAGIDELRQQLQADRAAATALFQRLGVQTG
jgi:riboflavin kinase/FMN adenylyltransferase